MVMKLKASLSAEERVVIVDQRYKEALQKCSEVKTKACSVNASLDRLKTNDAHKFHDLLTTVLSKDF